MCSTKAHMRRLTCKRKPRRRCQQVIDVILTTFVLWQTASFLYLFRTITLGHGSGARVHELRTDPIDLYGGAGRFCIGANNQHFDLGNFVQATEDLDAATERAAKASDPEDVKPDKELSKSEFESEVDLAEPLERKLASWCSIRRKSRHPCREAASSTPSASEFISSAR